MPPDDKHRILTPTFLLGFLYNFLVALNFSNNAIFPLYVTHEGGTAETIGLFMGAFSLAAVLGRPLVGIMTDRLGARPVLILGSLLLGASPLGYLALLDNGLVSWVWLLRIAQGFGFGAHFTAYFTFAGQYAPAGRRNETVAKYGLSGMAAQMIGPYLGERIVESQGLNSFFLMLAGFGLLGTMLAFTLPNYRQREHIQPSTAPSTVSRRYGRIGFVMVLAAFLAVSFSTAPAFLAPLAEERNITGFALFFSGFSLTGITIRLFGSRWGDRYGLRRVLIPAFFLYSVGLIVVYLSNSLTGIILAGTLCGLAHGVAFPAVTTLGFNLAPTAHVGRTMALITGTMDGGSALAALALGIAAGKWGYPHVFLLASAAPLLACLLIVLSVLRKPTPIFPQKPPGQ